MRFKRTNISKALGKNLHSKNYVFVIMTTMRSRTLNAIYMTSIIPPLLIYCWLLLSRFSRVRHCATPETAAHQAPPSLGFSRQEHRSGLPFPSPMHESEKWKWSRSVMSETLSDPMDCSPPGSSVHGIFQARVLEWGAIAFSILISGPQNSLSKEGISAKILTWKIIYLG